MCRIKTKVWSLITFMKVFISIKFQRFSYDYRLVFYMLTSFKRKIFIIGG